MKRPFCRIIALICLFTLTNVSFAEDDFASGKTYHNGFFSFYLDDNTADVFLEIADFEQEFLFQSSLPYGIGSNDIGLDRGQLGDTRLVKFERVGNKVFLKQINTYYRANSSNRLEREAVTEAFASSIIWGFKVETEIDGKVIINYSDFLLSDIHQVANRLKSAKQGNYSIDTTRSGLFAKRTKAFVDNTEFEATITFKGSNAGKYLKSVSPDSTAISVHMHHSLVRLPDSKYKTRDFHPYSGMWAVEHADYASSIDEPLIKRVIPRHRLAKKHPEANISEPVQPIIYYLDPGVPEPIKSALIDGALWWDQAFAAIGYKNAFQVKMLPDDADPMDIRYNVIQWVHRATRGWSYGASVIDPRTGEILKGHVTLGSLRVRQDYLIALGLTSPFDSAETDTSKQKAMALARIRQLSAHEVGHTLGIAHNFSASVNDRASVMDYPHPYVTLDPQGNIDLSNAYDMGIGEWDKHVVHYAYGTFKDESTALKDIIASAKSKGLLYMSDPDARPQGGAEASGHLWDNGANPTKELHRVMQVRNAALNNLGVNTIADGTPFSEIENALVPIYNYHRFQVEAVAKIIAGIEYTYAVKGEDNVPMTFVAGKQQQQAIEALLSTLDSHYLTLSEQIIMLIPPKAYGYSRTRESFNSKTSTTFDPVSAAQASAKHTLSLLLNSSRLARLSQQHAIVHDIPPVKSIISQVLNSSIQLESTDKPQKGLALMVQQRVNQQVLDSLLALFHQENTVAEVRTSVYGSLLELQQWLAGKTSYHLKNDPYYNQYQLLEQQIGFSLRQGTILNKEVPMSLPPGSPIGGY